jgi:Icc protein
MRLLHITDPHLHADPTARMRGVCTDDTLRAVLDHAMGAARPPDAVLATGDLVQDETPGGYERFRQLLGGLGIPVFCVPGNHDAPALMTEVLRDAPFQVGGSARLGAWQLVCLDSSTRHDDGGRLSAAELDRLRSALGTAPATPTLIALHHHPVPMGSRWLDGVPLRNPDDLLGLIADQPQVRAVVWGHVHQASDRWRGGLRLLSTPSTCAQFRPHCDDFALDDLPPGYRWLDLDADGRLRTEVVWVRQ